MTARLVMIGGSALAAVVAGLVATPPASAACGTGPYSGGDGTSSNPYQISSAADLVTLRDTTADFGCYFIQTASIDLSTVAQWSTGIGISGNAFSGNFDGNGKTISNLNVVRNSGSVSGLGLFGWLEGTVEDVTVSGTVSNNQHFVGGLVGLAGPGATVSSSSASVAVTGTYAVGGLVGYAPAGAGAGAVIEDSNASGNVTATATIGNSYAGGLAGHIQSSTVIRRSYATGDVRGQAQWIGGLVGRAQSATIEQSFATGSVTNTQAGGAASTGGLIGEAERTPISDSFATGNVQAGASAAYIGGLVGLLNQSTGQITRSYSIGRIIGGSSSTTGGLVGEIFNSGTVNASLWNTETSEKVTSDGGAGVKGKTTAELLQLITYTDDTAGFNWNTGGQRIAPGFNVSYTWGICSTVNNGYPFLTAFYSTTPCATSPQSPTLNSATGGNASLTLNWTLGSDGGSPVTDVEYSTDDSVTWRSVDDSTATTDTISLDSAGNPLVNGTTYQVRVRAVNSVGNGAVSNMLPGTPTKPTPPPVFTPSAPLNVTGVAGNAQAVISWEPPASSGSFAVTDYQAVVSPGGQSCTAKAPNLRCTITGLTNGTSYTAMVRALNGVGWGAWSDPSEPFTPVDPVAKSILITGTRAQIDGRSGVRALGQTTGLVGATLQARVHLSGEVDYSDGSRRTVADDGSFTWQRRTNKKVYVYFRDVDDPAVRSNRIIIPIR